MRRTAGVLTFGSVTVAAMLAAGSALAGATPARATPAAPIAAAAPAASTVARAIPTSGRELVDGTGFVDGRELAGGRELVEGSADATFSALFAAGAQVYGRVAVRPAGTYPPSNEVVLRRVDGPGAIAADGIGPGAPGRAYFAYFGTALPEAFTLAESAPGSGIGWGVAVPVDPATLEPQDDGPSHGDPAQSDPTQGDYWRHPVAVYFYSGPVGAVAGLGIATPYLG